jgi:hypothetical protein
MHFEDVQIHFLTNFRRKKMKARVTLCLLIGLLITSFSSFAGTTKLSAAGDTMYITGGTLTGGENAGSLENAINGDTTTGARLNPNRVYALYEGDVYFQMASINVFNPTGTLSIVGVPNPGNPTAHTKPIIVIVPTAGVHVAIGNSVNQLYGSLKMVNIHYQTMQIDGFQNNELFFLGTQGQTAQVLTIDNCFFEFSNIDLFDATDEAGAIGGWKYGAKFFITNSYFRNLFFAGQWWGSRIFQCKHPIDTLWIENNTVGTGGLTFLQQNQLTDFAYINHNTIVNNKKYWVLSPYFRQLFVTNNIFMNQNWVGEDTNVTNSGQDPDKQFESTINIDTVNATNGVTVQARYYDGDSTHYSPLVGLNKMSVLISNNINYYNPLLINGYYVTTPGTIDATAYPLSYLTWYFTGPWEVKNIPGQWMNARTQALFTAYAPAIGINGFIEEATSTANPGTVTPDIADASVVSAMATWNQNQYGDPLFPSSGTILSTSYIQGDYLATTLPGLISGAKSDAITGEGAGIQVGITKFTDLTEDYSQTTHVSALDGFPLGSLIWNDTQNSTYAASHANELSLVLNRYVALGGTITGVKGGTSLKPEQFSLSQNYPNPFNPTTTINFNVGKASNVKLAVYNMLGQKVATLVNSHMNAGPQSVVFDASRLASGVYFYRLDAGSFSSVQKMLLVK